MAKVMDPNNIRHYEPTGAGEPACGAKDGWWIATPRYVTCEKCRKHLPRTVHYLLAPGKSKCGRGTITSTNATSNPARVTCAQCIPRPSKTAKTLHMRLPSPDPLEPDTAVCNLPYAGLLTDNWDDVTCGICRSRWSPTCRFCRNTKASREPVCRDPDCRKRHREEMMGLVKA